MAYVHLSDRMARFNAFGASGLTGATYMLKYHEKFILIIFGNVCQFKNYQD